VLIRPAARDDLTALNEIYNHYVRATHVTFDVEPWSLARREEWFEHYGPAGRHRVFVAATDAGAVAGYASSSPYRPKPAYDTSVEVSAYLAPEATGHGAGTRLYAALLGALEGEDVHRAYAGIALPNAASVALHERCGFVHVGLFTEQGRKFGRYWDVAWYERRVPLQMSDNQVL
jgi:phosphinothricin acetyltransferase